MSSINPVKSFENLFINTLLINLFYYLAIYEFSIFIFEFIWFKLIVSILTNLLFLVEFFVYSVSK